MNEFANLNKLYAQSAPESQENLIINDPEVNEIPVNEFEIVNPHKSDNDVVKEALRC